MWTHKYKSIKYLDLLTPEHVNMNVLQWLKSWDPIVFDRPAPSKARIDTFDKYQRKQVDYSIDNKKVIILYGPPGTGKSTLARVLARMSGYEPREINGSDLRSPP
jgi:chromosome transmission fidelity protein 18